MFAPAMPIWMILNAINFAILILVLEAIFLCAFHIRTKRGLPVITVLLISASGLGLLLALRGAVSGGETLWIALGLSIGGIAHAIDLFRRFKKSS